MNKFVSIFKYCILLPFNFIWYIQLIIPRNKNIWIFGAWYGQKYSDNTKALFEYIIENNRSIRVIWLTRKRTIKEELNQQGIECYMIWSFKGILLSLKAKIIVLCSGKQDVNCFFINGATVINTWHGCPMKKIGLDDHFNYKSKFKNKVISFFFPFICEWNYNYVVSTSSIFTNIMSSSFNVPKSRVLETGYPRNDIFYNHSLAPYNSLLKETFKDCKIVYYLPTFRTQHRAQSIFNLSDYNEQNFSIFLEKENIVFVSKAHYVNKFLTDKIDNPSSRILHLVDLETTDINFLLKDADLLITDYSGAYFDYLLTERPIIFASFDLTEYQTKSREMYFKYDEIISGPIATNWMQIMNYMKASLNCTNEIKDIKKKKMQFNKFDDPNNSKRLYNAISKISF